jgi:ribonuclease HI
MAHYKLYFDGSCGPKNPGGTAAYGYVLLREGQEEPVRVGSGVIGTGEGMSNNLAEFYALDKGLTEGFIFCNDTTERHTLQVFGDSNLVIQVMNRHWRAKSDKLYYSAYEDALANLNLIRRRGHAVTFDWIPREKNTLCDDLSKEHQKKAA